MKKPNPEAVSTNNALLNVITPMELVFKRNSVTIGEYTGRVYGVIRFPPVLELGWLSKVCNIPGTISAISFMPADSGELIEGISRNVQLNRGMAESAKDPLTRQRAERGAEDGERLMMRIDQHGETVGYGACSLQAVWDTFPAWDMMKICCINIKNETPTITVNKLMNI